MVRKLSNQSRQHQGKGEVHVFAAAYREDELPAILRLADHVVFNTLGQWQRFQPIIAQARDERAQQQMAPLQFGLRVNPEHSEGVIPLYDPCAPGSRLGTTLGQLQQQLDSGVDISISGFHFHTLFEQNFTVGTPGGG